MRLRRDSAANHKASFENRKLFSEESEGFFRRALGSYTHKFPKRGAASLTYFPRSRLDLPRSRLGLPHLCLSRNSGPAMEGFSNRGINFKDAYHIYMYVMCWELIRFHASILWLSGWISNLGLQKKKVHVAAILDECMILWGEPERVQ